MKRLLIGFALAGCAWAGQTVRIGVFGLFRPAELTVRGRAIEAIASGNRFAPDGAKPLRCAARQNAMECTTGSETFMSDSVSVIPRGDGSLVLAIPGRIERRFEGSLDIAAADGELIPVITMEREIAVASSTAAESPPGAPREALKAQAVAIRSYYAASQGRHARFDFCDTTHCQFLKAALRHDAPAARAARETRGLALAWNGRPIAALYSASCGGHTRAAPRGPDLYPFFAVACPYCARAPRPACSYCVRTTGAWSNRRGRGAGHGVGLCQTGAAVMAEGGAPFDTILRHYFPNTILRRMPE